MNNHIEEIITLLQNTIKFFREPRGGLNKHVRPNMVIKYGQQISLVCLLELNSACGNLVLFSIM